MCSGYALAFSDTFVPSMTPPTSGSLLEATVAKCSLYTLFLPKNIKKTHFFAFFFKNICVYGFFVVPLHSLSKRKYDIRSRCYRIVA